MLHAAIEGAETIGAVAVEAVAADMGADAPAAAAATPARAPEPAQEKVLPFRAARLAPVAANEPAPPPARPDPALERRIAALEARAEEQEAMLRRVLILLVDWVENSQENAYRTHAA